MSYIGRGIDQIDNISTLDNLSFNGSSATFNLTQNSVAFVPVSADALQIQIDGVIQANNFTISGSTLTFDFVPSASSVCNSVKHFGVGIITSVSDGAVTNVKLGADSVNGTKIADDSISDEHLDITAITGQTAITSLADTDKFLVSDASDSGNLKYVEKQYLGGGTHVLLGSTNVTSNVSNVTFQSLFSDTYTNYYLTGRGINKSESSHLHLRFLNGGTTDSGTNYDDVYGVGVKSRNSNTWTGRHNSANQIQFMESAGINTGTFTMWIDTYFRGTSTHDYVNLHGIESHWIGDSSGLVTTTFGGVYLPNTNVDGIKFITSSGTITSGRFSLYGVKHA